MSRRATYEPVALEARCGTGAPTFCAYDGCRDRGSTFWRHFFFFFPNDWGFLIRRISRNNVVLCFMALSRKSYDMPAYIVGVRSSFGCSDCTFKFIKKKQSFFFWAPQERKKASEEKRRISIAGTCVIPRSSSKRLRGGKKVI